MLKEVKEVKEVIEKDIRPLLEMEGGSIELESVDDDGVVTDKVPVVKEVVAVDDAKARFEELLKR